MSIMSENSHENKCLIFLKVKKDFTLFLSAAVVIGALMVNFLKIDEALFSHQNLSIMHRQIESATIR